MSSWGISLFSGNVSLLDNDYFLGPGVGFYKWDLSLDTNLSAEDSKLFFDKLNAALEEKFPGYEGTLGEGDFQKKGAKSTTSLGYRCQ